MHLLENMIHSVCLSMQCAQQLEVTHGHTCDILKDFHSYSFDFSLFLYKIILSSYILFF